MRALLSLLLLPACDPVAALCETAGETPASVTLGTGESAFEAVQDRSEVGYVLGPQGGWHVWGAVRTTGLVHAGPTGGFSDPANPTIDFDVRLDDGSFEDRFAPSPRQLTGGPDAAQLTGETVTLALTDDLDADGAPATYAVEVTDACGTTARDAASIVLRFAGSVR